jgi:HAE1 family hydrophobic/amphiphilic exporter-1
VAAVTVRGGLERLVRVEPREDWLQARGVTVAQLSAALTSENVNVAGGVVREGENEYLIRTLNEFTDLDDIRDLVILRPDGTRVRVGEVADVREASADPEVVATLDGADAVELEVYREADANIVTVARAVKAALADQGATSGIGHVVLDDQARFIEAALDNLVDDAILGGLLAILVTFVFLRDWGTTAIISTAIPICLVVTFAVMYLAGVSLNLMSLGGLALGVSMVIDSGTVVLENIQLKLDAGLSRAEAAVQGTSEVAAAVFASVLTGMAVFFPIVFVEGIAGQIFGDLALTVVFSLAASLVVALLFIPMLAAQGWDLPEPVARARDVPASAPRAAWTELRQRRAWWAWPWALLRFSLRFPSAMLAWLGGVVAAVAGRLLFVSVRAVAGLLNRGSLRLADAFLVVYGAAETRFGTVLSRSLRRPGLVLLVAAASLVFAWVAAGQLGAELLPEVAQGRFTVELSLPVGTPLPRTSAQVSALEREVRGLAGVEQLYTVAGTERRADARADEGENTARMLVQLTPGGDMAAREDALMEAIRARVATFPSMEARFRRPALFSFRTPLEVVVHATELSDLRSASDTALAALAEEPALADVRSSMTRGYPEVRIRYDRARLAAMGLSVGDVAASVRARVQGERPTKLSRGERRVDVLVRLDEQDRGSIAALAALNVNPRLTPPIRLDSVATLEEGEGPSEIRRIDQRRAVVVSANLAGFDLGSASTAVERTLDGAAFPAGTEWEVAGQKRELERGVRSLQMALGLAVFLVYVIMASTFESIRDPFVILFSVPLAAVGVAAGLVLTGTALSVTVFIGLIVLAGVVVANAIVLVDAINRLREEGRSLDEAITEAAATRLRPILITALNSVLGLLPLALGLGEGSEMQRPLAITIIFGLASSTVLTLVVVPVVYRLVTGRRTAAASAG